MSRLAVLSLHTSPLVQPGSGDGGGMNVYVRELGAALAQAGVTCDIYTRASHADQPEVVDIEPGLRVHHIAAGPSSPVAKEALPGLLDEFGDRLLERLADDPPDVLHANYWLSGMVGHRLKHELDRPLVSTFHTLARVKAEVDLAEPEQRALAEAEIIGCSDAICVSCPDEAAQMVRLYGADPERLEMVPPGVHHAFFSPGPKAGARAALGIGDQPMLLFVGRIQPLKGVDVAVRTLAALDQHPDAVLWVVGGPSGADGDREMVRVRNLVSDLGLSGRVRFVAPQPHHLLSTYYRAADVGLVPSRTESFGLVALEAAACGLPVVAAAVGGLRTLVEHGGTGFLVEGRDPAVYAAYVGEVLDQPALAAEMRERAARRGRSYGWATSAARLRRLYADLSTRVPVACR